MLCLYLIVAWLAAAVHGNLTPSVALDSTEWSGTCTHASPGLAHLVYVTSEYDTATNNNTRKLWLQPFDDFASRKVLLEASVSSPTWVSESVLLFLANLDGTTTQVWYLDVTKDNEPQAIAIAPIDIESFTFHVPSSHLAFTAKVDATGDLKHSQDFIHKRATERFHTGVVYDQLFVRHWDTYMDPELFTQLFVAALDLQSMKVGTPINVMAQLSLGSPVATFGDDSSYSFSADGSLIAFSSRVPGVDAAWNTNLDVYIAHTDGSKPVKSVSAPNRGADSSPVFSPDGHYLAWLQMQTPQYESDRNIIVLYDVHGGTHTTIADSWDRSPSSMAWSSDSKVLYVTAEDLGHGKVFSISVDTGAVQVLVHEHASSSIEVLSDPSTGDDVLVLSRSSMTAPPNVYSLATHHDDASRPYPKFIQRTFFNKGNGTDLKLSRPEEFWFQGAHKDPVMGWFLKPAGYVHGKSYPLAFLIHGGPEGSWEDGWSWRWNPQVYASAGYAVAAINVHGSTGYGSKFTRSILGEWGGAPYKDLIKGLDYLFENVNWIDRSRVCALGASYGGYMVNWINGMTDRFACLVTHDGMFDTRGGYYATDELWFPEMEFKGPAFDPSAAEVYEKWNPALYLFLYIGDSVGVDAHVILSNVKKWKTPTLVIHSELDYRLPITEGLAVFTALQRQGIPSRLLYFPDESTLSRDLPTNAFPHRVLDHWVLKPANVIKWFDEILHWLHKYTPHSPHQEGSRTPEPQDTRATKQKHLLKDTV